MPEKKTRRKPTGTTGRIEFRPEGTVHHLLVFPQTKEQVELFIAKGFCNPGAVSYVPHLKRYAYFHNLQQQQENSLDFKVDTGLGMRWLELCEFAPLEQFGGKYDLVPEEWDARRMFDLFRMLIEKKARKSDGCDVILLIYKTHQTLFVPPPIIRAVRQELMGRPVPFESIYYISPYSSSDMGVWEVWPGDSDDQGWAIRDGKLIVGP